MTQPSASPHTEKPYHHGQLRQALLTAALQLAETRGLSALTLREVARLAGVSHAAPYHHFADKSALIEALAAEGFQHLRQALQLAVEQATGSAIVQLQALGMAYVQFALVHPTEFRLMFRPELREAHTTGSASASEIVGQVAQAAYQVLIEAVERCQAEGFVITGDSEPFVMTCWATMHGLATLFIDGLPGDWHETPALHDKSGVLAQQVTAILTNGFQATASAQRFAP